MGLLLSRLNLEGLPTGRRRSQQNETLYSYSLNKNYFSNYFLMGGERFDVNDPEYLFGDNCDLNFLSCTKPYSLPYKQAQKYLLSNLSIKEKSISKVSSRIHRFSSPFYIFTGRHGQASTNSSKQDAQTQTLQNSEGLTKAPEPSQPLVMFVNIRKETLRLVKSSNVCSQHDSDQNSLTNSTFVSATDQVSYSNTINKPSRERRLSTNQPKNHSKKLTSQQRPSNGHSTASSRTTAVTIYPDENENSTDNDDFNASTSSPKKFEFDVTSLLSDTSSTKSGYASVKGDGSVSCGQDSSNDDDFEDALNDPANLSTKGDSERTQQQVSLLNESRANKENIETRITLSPEDAQANDKETDNSSNKVYNIEFYFDAEVDCSIRIFYFCTRELTSNGITYKPLHATYKSKLYNYKRGLNQKFDQQEHTFQPYLFDEDLLIYKPLDEFGNYNSGAVFPIVIHCVSLEGPTPRQSHSLVATIEKSQPDESYSIKPLKQLIFADGVQYILQDIYGIEHKQLFTGARIRTLRDPGSSNTQIKSQSLQSNLNLSDAASLTSVDCSLGNRQNRGSKISNQHKSLSSENTFECVICMSEERDTMLLPCRHLCLCSPCAKSLRYQANSCPICRCPFKAALNIRSTHYG